MAKDSEERLTSTVKFIKCHQAESTLNIEQFGKVTTALDSWMNTTSQPQKDILSALMSQNDTGVRRANNKTGRHYARSAILLKCALGVKQSDWKNETAFVKGGDGNYKNAYQLVSQFVRDALFSTVPALSNMLEKLRANPIDILEKYKFTIDGGTKAGNPVTYGVWMAQGGYKINCMGMGPIGHHLITALNIPATSYADIQDSPNAIAGLSSTVHQGTDLMFTTQFTGCSFCFKKSPDGANIKAAHIDPGKGNGAPSGKALSQTLRDTGGFEGADAGEFKVYGRVENRSNTFGYPESAGQMTIIGVRKGAQWQLYSQITSLSGALIAKRIDG